MTIKSRFAVSDAFWFGRRVLITGHTGFKGGWLAMWLHSLGAIVSGLSLPPDTADNLFDAVGLKDICRHRIGDIRSFSVVLETIKEEDPEIIFHLAAQPLVRRSYLNPIETIQVNVIGTTNVLESCRISANVKALMVITSDKVYENYERNSPYREDERLGGHDLYSVSKACAELVTTGYQRAFQSDSLRHCAIATARAGNVIGGGDWAEDRIIPDLVRAFSVGESAKVRAPLSVRPWQHVIDVVAGYLMYGRALIETPDSCPRSLNFGPSKASLNVGELAERFSAIWEGKPSWTAQLDSSAAHEATLLSIDSTRAAEFLGWKTALPIELALQLTAAWYRQHATHSDKKNMMKLSLKQISDVTSNL